MAKLGLESRPPDFCSMRGKVVFISGYGDISHSVRCLALGTWPEKIYTSQDRKTFVLPSYRVHLQKKINSIFVARG